MSTNVTKMRVKGVTYNLNGKLYNSTGSNTDGSMTQSAITSELEDVKEYAQSAYALAEEVREDGKTQISGDVTNNPDEEDITTEINTQTGLGELKLKNRQYIPIENSKGYVILRKGYTLAEQLLQSDTIYEIRYIFDLDEEDVIVPNNCVFYFNGGSIRNGSLTLNETRLDGTIHIPDVILSGSIINKVIHSEWWDDCDCFADSCSSLSGFTKIDIKHGIYTFKKSFNITHDVLIEGNDSKISVDSSVITFFNLGNEGRTTSDAGIEQYTYLSSTASKGDISINVTSVSGFSNNDVIFLRDLTTSSFQNARNYQEGEITVINKIDGNTIYIDNPLFGTYANPLNCIVFKPTMVDVKIHNLHLIHLQSREDFAIHAIMCKYGLNTEFSNLTIENFDIGVRLQGCYNSSVHDCQINACESTDWNIQSAANQYGVFCANSQNIFIDHITAVASNHGVATGGGYTELYAIVNRCIKITYCNCTNRYPNYYGINLHGDTEYAEISHCSMTGVDIGGNHLSVKNCIITPHEQNAIAISIMEITGFDFCFEDNEIEGVVYDRGVISNRTLVVNNPSKNEHIRFVRNKITLNELYTYTSNNTIYANPFVEFIRYDHFNNSGSSWYGVSIHIDFIDNTFINNTKYAGYIKVALKNPIFTFINNRFYNTELRISLFDRIYIEGNYFERSENVIVPESYDSYAPYHIDFRNPSVAYTASVAHISGNTFANDVVLNENGSANSTSLIVRTRSDGSNIANLYISNNNFFVNKLSTVNIVNQNNTLLKVFFIDNYVTDYTYTSGSTSTIDYAVYLSGEELYIDHFGKDLSKQVSIIVDKIGKVINKSVILPNRRTIKTIDSGVSSQSQIPNPATWAYKSNYIGYQYFDTTNNRWMMWNGNYWVDGNGYRVFDTDNSKILSLKGDTSSKPVLGNTTVDFGYKYYDTTTKSINVWSGEIWKPLAYGSSGFMNFTNHTFDIPVKLGGKDVGYYFFVRGKYPVFFYSSGESTDSGTGVTSYTNLWMKADGTLAYTVVSDSTGRITYTDNITSDTYTVEQ